MSDNNITEQLQCLDFHLPCDYPSCPDDGRATHSQTFLPCCCQKLVCAGCAAVIAEGAHESGEWSCCHCYSYQGTGALSDFVKIQRLAGTF